VTRLTDPPAPEPPAPAALPTARYAEKREAILAAAARCFNRQGVRGSTLAEIAASVGLVTNSVTYYYRKKEDLATACFLRSIAVFGSLVAEAMQTPDVAARVRMLMCGLVRLLADIEAGRAAPIVGFHDIRALPSPQVDEVFAAYNDLFRRVRGLLQTAETAGLSRDDLNARAHLVMSVLHWLRTWIGRHEPGDDQRAARHAADILVHGLGAAGSSWPDDERGMAWVPVSAASAQGPGEAFLRAATRLVNDQGYRGASVDKISAQLNVTKGSFYHHHDNKHDLISACFERSFAVMRQALVAAEEAPGTGWQRVCGAAHALVAYQLSPQGPLLRATAISALPDQLQRDKVRATMQGLGARLAGTLVDGMVDGSVRPLDPAIAAQGVIAAINAAAELQRWLPGGEPAGLVDVYARPMLEGVLCPSCSPRTANS
jgi:AcrR family transcriptional regulator